MSALLLLILGGKAGTSVSLGRAVKVWNPIAVSIPNPALISISTSISVSFLLQSMGMMTTWKRRLKGGRVLEAETARE